MRIERIIEDFLDYRAYVSHTLCQHRLFLGLSTPKNAREWLSDAAVWPLVHDEAIRLCGLAGTLYGIMASDRLASVFAEVHRTVKRMADGRGDLVDRGNDEALDQFREYAQILNNLFREMHMALEIQTPKFSRDAVLKALDHITSRQWLIRINEHMKTSLAEILRQMMADAENPFAPDLYRKFWVRSEDAYLLTRKAVVAVAAEDLPLVTLKPIRAAQRLLRATEAVVSCWSPSVMPKDRLAQIEKSIRTQGFESRSGVVESLTRGIPSE